MRPTRLLLPARLLVSDLAACCLQLEGELVSRAGLQRLRPEQFSSILILADESAMFGQTEAGATEGVMDAGAC